MTNLKAITIAKLKERGVTIENMASMVYKLQKKYNNNLKYSDCLEAIDKVLSKREVIHAVLTGINIDELVEKKKFDNEINETIFNDNSLYGIDEILALSIVNIYGSIALTNFGYLDKIKPSVIGKLDRIGKSLNHCHTFLDDIICAVVASGCSKIAHTKNINEF